MQLTIVRHAQSTGNAGGRWQGRDDTKLTDLGREQAALLGKRFLSEGYRPSHIYSSPLSRTFATAQIASSAWDLPIVPVDDLMETDIGAFTGLTWEEIESSMPEIAREFAATRSTDIIEGAESYAEKSERARRVVERVIADHSNEDSVLLVSHGGIHAVHHCADYRFRPPLGAERTQHWRLRLHNRCGPLVRRRADADEPEPLAHQPLQRRDSPGLSPPEALA